MESLKKVVSLDVKLSTIGTSWRVMTLNDFCSLISPFQGRDSLTSQAAHNLNKLTIEDKMAQPNQNNQLNNNPN